MNDIRVSSWDELNARLYADSWNEGLGRFRSNFAFRGVANANFVDLKTSLMRLGGDYVQLEKVILRAFRKYAHRDAVVGDSLWNWLALAQHHGLPTRLLDWTYSPYIAMHFATDEMQYMNVDGMIWCVDFVGATNYLPRELTFILEQEWANAFTVEMLSRAATTLQDFDKLSRQEFVCFLEPPSLDDRVINQYASFSVMSSPTGQLDKWLADRPPLYRRVIIPASLKWEVRDKLDQANITERMLFPGLDGLSKWLKRHYGPRSTTAKQ